MKNIILKIIIFAGFFLVLSEKVSFLNILVSIVIGLLVFIFNDDGLNVSKYLNFKTLAKWISFIMVLFIEVVKANFQVAKIALSVNMRIDPKIIIYQSRITDDLLLTILANVITLTPGTMTVDISKNKLKIHCLNQIYADALDDMTLEKLLFKIEGEING